MTLTRCLLVCTLAACFSGFGAEPRLGVERAISGLTIASSAGPKYLLATATDGEDFLVVWSDERAGGRQIIGARVSAEGEILDPLGIVIVKPLGVYSLDVRWRGDSYQVNYAYWRGAGLETEYRTVSVGRDGRVGEDQPQVVAPRIWPRNENGDTIVMRSERAISMLWFEGADGRWRSPIDISEWGYLREIFPIGSDDWVAVFHRGTGAYWVHLRKGAGVIKSVSMLPDDANSNYGFALAIDGIDIGIVWRTKEGRLWWTVVTATGELSRGPLEPEGGDGYTVNGDVAAIGDGQAFHFATQWSDERGQTHLRTFRVRDGTTSQSRDVMPGAPADPRLAAGERNLLAWRRSSPTGTAEIVVQVFDRGGSSDDGELTVLSRAGAFQDAPRAAAGRGGALATWREMDGDLPSIRARWMPDSGTSPLPFTVATAIDVRSARVAECNGTYAIIWIDTEVQFKKTGWQREEERLMLRRYDAQGTALDPSPVVLIRHGFVSLEIARRANGFQIVWKDRNDFIWSLFVTRDGTVTPPTPTVVAMNADLGGAPVVTAGDSAVIVWSDIDVPTNRRDKTRTLRASRVSPAGVMGVPMALVFVETERPDPFAAASDGTRLMVLWPAERKGLPCVAIRLFSLDGLPLSFTETIACGAFSGSPQVKAGWDGERWWVITSGGDQILAHTISGDGTPLATFEVTRATSVALDTDLIPTATGMTVFYARSDEAAGHSQRGFLRSLTATPRIRSVRH